MKLVVLYEELAGYFIASISHFSIKYNCEVHIFKKETNSVAPFEFTNRPNIFIYDRKDFNKEELLEKIESIDPISIFAGGWSYKPYLHICKKYVKSKPVIVGFDNQWCGSLKQRIVSILGKSFIKTHFNKCFVPGQGQLVFAQKLGFKNSQISLNAYCCDYELYSNIYTQFKEEKQNKIPKRLLYVGRYAPEKGIEEVWTAFSEISKDFEWELWCVGKGSVTPIAHPKIKHFGFVQPEKISDYIAKTSVLILPSHFEPWGVVVHEYAAAGFPILSSNKVGASELFVEDNKNGYLFSPGNTEEIKNAMIQIFNKSENDFLKMTEESIRISKKITNDIWSDTLFRITQG
jgi:glycosyltransferase involved in cell wall biosynthesis